MNKFVQDFKTNAKNKTWWITVISAGIIIAKSFGFDLTKIVGNDWQNTLTLIFTLLTALGLNLNISESDSNVNQTTQTENISTVNNASASIKVDNPENAQALNNTVNANSSTNPQ